MFKKVKDTLAMYDRILEDWFARKSILRPDAELSSQQIHIGYSAVSSASRIFKYFIVRKYSDYVGGGLLADIRGNCAVGRARIDFTTHLIPHAINWSAPEMKQRMKVWQQFTDKDDSGSVFDYRESRAEILRKQRIVKSTKFLNESDLEYKRAFGKMFVVVTVSGERTDEGLLDLEDSIQNLRSYCAAEDILIREVKTNMIEWLQVLSPLSMSTNKIIDTRITRKIVTDDIMAHFGAFRQGRVGETGVSLGMDVLSRVPVLHKLKADPDKAENWLICAETGGGKSYWAKALITYVMASNIVVTVLDYEGDEYTNLYRWVHAADPRDAVLISMGKGSSEYFDPLILPDLTGDEEIDSTIMEQSVSFALAMFAVIVAGSGGVLTDIERKIVSEAIRRVFDSCNIDENRETWANAKQAGISLPDVYEEMQIMQERNEYAAKQAYHDSLDRIIGAAAVYFEPGEARYGTFSKPLSADNLYKAKFIVFSFGAKGAAASTQDRDILALRQLSVAYISTNISNNCKYVRKCFNLKLWEEFQRWSDIAGSADIIGNSMTGGRKRGEINFIVTNDLSSVLDESNAINARLRQNIQCYVIGKVRDRQVREQFCDKFGLKECKGALDRISKATGDVTDISSYKNSFLAVLDNGKKAIVKVMLPENIAKSELFKTGVAVDAS